MKKTYDNGMFPGRMQWLGLIQETGILEGRIRQLEEMKKED